MSNKLYIGWDVGGWNCEKNTNSRDAIVVLGEQGKLLGYSTWMNLKHYILEANSTDDFIISLLGLSNLDYNGEDVVLAIDTPLGYSEEFRALINCNQPAAFPDTNKNIDNPYLFRITERHIYNKKLNYKNKSGEIQIVTPLSAVQSMIGAQSTKGLHVIAQLGLTIKDNETGVWNSTDGKLKVIEAYPTLHAGKDPDIVWHNDLRDAWRCAYIAHIFGTNKNSLEHPPEHTPKQEGWIWYVNRD